MMIAECLDCGHDISLGAEPWIGQPIRCQNCGVQLEVINVEPLELDWVFLEPAELENDWDWDWPEDEDREEEKVGL